MNTFYKLVSYIVYISAVIFLAVSNFIVISNPNEKYARDIFGFRIPESPIWASFIPGGGYINFVFEWFSLHGLFIFTIFITLIILGLFISNKVKKV